MSKPKAQVRKAKHVPQEYRDPTRDYLKEAETLMWTDENGRPISRVDLINYDTSDRTVFEPSNILSSPQNDYYDLSFLNNEKRKLKAQETILNNKAVVSSVLDLVPIAGDIKGGYEGILQPLQQGDYLTAGIGVGMLFLPNFIEKPLKWARKGAKKLYNWSKNKTDVVEKAMNLAGYKKLYHGVGTNQDFQLPEFKSSYLNFGIHMSADKKVAEMFANHNNPRIKEAYVKTRNAPLVMDMHYNDYRMFDPEYSPEVDIPYSNVYDDIYIDNFKGYPDKGTVSELYYTTKYPEYTHKLTKDELNRFEHSDYRVDIPKGTKVRPINMLEINWPNMPKEAKRQWQEINSKVKSGQITKTEANTMMAEILSKNNIPVLKYKNAVPGEQMTVGQIDYIITDPNAFKLNVPKFEIPNYIFLGLGTGVTGYGGYKLYENLTNNE